MRAFRRVPCHGRCYPSRTGFPENEPMMWDPLPSTFCDPVTDELFSREQRGKRRAADRMEGADGPGGAASLALTKRRTRRKRRG